jgi:hypothetical protein
MTATSMSDVSENGLKSLCWFRLKPIPPLPIHEWDSIQQVLRSGCFNSFLQDALFEVG